MALIKIELWHLSSVEFFLQPYLDQGLVGYVSGIGGHFDAIEQVLGQAQRDSFS